MLYTRARTVRPRDQKGIMRRINTRSDDGYTLVELLVTIMLAALLATLVISVVTTAMTHTRFTERRDEAISTTAGIMSKARQVDYAELGFYTPEIPGAMRGNVTLPLGKTTSSDGTSAQTVEKAILLGDTRPAGSVAFVENADTTRTDRNIDYRTKVYVTEVPPIAPDTISRAKRVTVQVEWAPTGTPLNGACSGPTRCLVETFIRVAAGSDLSPADGSSAATTSTCTAAAVANVCETYVRSGRVLDGSTMTGAGADIPLQNSDVDFYARTSSAATSVRATWTYRVAVAGGGTSQVTKHVDLESNDGGIRWTGVVPADLPSTDPTDPTSTAKGTIRPGKVSVRFSARIGGEDVLKDVPAHWSYQIATGYDSDHVRASVNPASASATSWCVPSGVGPAIVVDVTGHSVGMTMMNPPTSASDTAAFVFATQASNGSVTTSKVPATLNSVRTVTQTDSGIELPVSSDATWSAVAPATTNCATTSLVGIEVHRTADATTTVIPLKLRTP